MTRVDDAEVLVVTPTLGRRPGWLAEAVESLHDQAVTVRHVVVVPARVDLSAACEAEIVVDPGAGLSAAFNAGLHRAEGERFLLWLNDDDRIAPAGLDALVAALSSRPTAVAAVGAIRVIDPLGRPLLTLRSGPLTVRLLPWGPGMMASPGVLYRLDAVVRAGGLDDRLVHAGDLDLLLRLTASGPIAAVRRVVGEFRWHADSLTVRDPRASLEEAEDVRRRFHADRSAASAAAYAAWRPVGRLVTRTAKAAVTVGALGRPVG